MEEQTDDTLSSDEVDIAQPWPPAPTLVAAVANRSSPGLHRDRSPELASKIEKSTKCDVRSCEIENLEVKTSELANSGRSCWSGEMEAL